MAFSKFENYLLREIFSKAKALNGGVYQLPLNKIIEVVAKASKSEYDLFLKLCKDYRVINVPKYNIVEMDFIRTVYPFTGELKNGLIEIPKEIIISFCMKYPASFTKNMKSLCDQLGIIWYPYTDIFYSIKDSIYLEDGSYVIPREAYIVARERLLTLGKIKEFDDMCQFFGLVPETVDITETVDRNKYVTIFDHPEVNEEQDTSKRRTSNDLELEELIKTKILPKVSHHFNSSPDSMEMSERKTLPLNVIVKMRFNAEELDFVMNYLAEEEVTVRGYSQDMTKYPNYEYVATYHYGDQSVKFEYVDYDVITFDHFILLNKINEKIEEAIANNLPVDRLLAQKTAVVNELIMDVGKLYDFCLYKNGLNSEDDRQEGFIILRHLIENFDVYRGYRFSTYMFKFLPLMLKRIKHQKEDHISFGASARDDLSRFRAAKYYFESQGKHPTLNDYALYLGWPIQKVEDFISFDAANEKVLYGYLEDEDIPDHVFEENNNYSPESIEGDSNPDTLAVGIEDLDFDLNEIIERKALVEGLQSVLETLTSREKLVLEMRFGLNGQKTHSLEEVGRVLNVTRERVRQIEAKALRKLRHPSRVDMITGGRY